MTIVWLVSLFLRGQGQHQLDRLAHGASFGVVCNDLRESPSGRSSPVLPAIDGTIRTSVRRYGPSLQGEFCHWGDTPFSAQEAPLCHNFTVINLRFN